MDSAFLSLSKSLSSLPPRFPRLTKARSIIPRGRRASLPTLSTPESAPQLPSPSRNTKARPILPRVLGPTRLPPMLSLRNVSRKKRTLFDPFNRSYAFSASFSFPSSPVSSAVAATSPATMSIAPTTAMRLSVLPPPKPNIVCAIVTGIKRSAMNMR